MLAWAWNFDLQLLFPGACVGVEEGTPAREVAGEGCESPVAPLHGFAQAILAAEPWSMGEGVSDHPTLPAVRRWGLAFPQRRRACRPWRCWLMIQLRARSFSFSHTRPVACPGKEVQAAPPPLFLMTLRNTSGEQFCSATQDN